MVMLATSCTVGPNYATPKSKVAAEWMPNSAATKGAFTAAESCWWRSFHDPILDDLIETAFKQNSSLQIAGVRVLEARAKLNKSIGNLFPQQQAASGQIGYTRLSDGLTEMIPGANQNYVSANVLFGASWEVDLWGKFRRNIESDRAAYLGSIASYDDVLVTLISDVASAYVNLRTLEARLDVAQRNVETQKEGLRIATAQFIAGEVSELDKQQATAQLAQTEAAIPQLREAISQTRNGLALLLGETPDEIARHLHGPGPIPTAPRTVGSAFRRTCCAAGRTCGRRDSPRPPSAR
jgi:outer membrane protein TolC